MRKTPECGKRRPFPRKIGPKSRNIPDIPDIPASLPLHFTATYRGIIFPLFLYFNAFAFMATSRGQILPPLDTLNKILTITHIFGPVYICTL